MLQRCATCRRILHPPVVLCPSDHSGDLRWEPVGGGGRVEAWTENRYSWMPDFPAPYLIALVAIDEDPSARLLTNLVGVDAADVWTGMPVRVVFEHRRRDDGDDVFLPLFTPVRPV